MDEINLKSNVAILENIEESKSMGEIPITTNRTLKEVEQSIKNEKEKSTKLKDWENVDTIYNE